MGRRKKSLASRAGLDSAEAIAKIQQLKVIELALLGERLRRIRSDRKISQRDLTSGLFTSAYLSSVELGKTRPTLETLEILAERLGEPVDFFLRPIAAGRFKRQGQSADFDVEQLRQLELKQHLYQAETALAENNLALAGQELNEVTNPTHLIYADQVYFYLLQATLHNRQERPEQALATLEQAAANPQTSSILTGDGGFLAWFELEKGYAYKAQNHYYTALDHFQRGLNNEAEKSRWWRELLLEAGDTYRLVGEYEKAAEVMQKGLSSFNPTYDLAATEALYKEAQAQAEQGNFQQSAFLLGQASRQALRARETASRLDFVLKTSRLSYQLKNYEVARNFARVAESLIQLNEEQPDSDRLSTFVLLAKSYFQTGETSLAHLYLDHAAALFEKSPDLTPLEKAAYFEIAALVYAEKDQHQPEKAAGYYDRAIALLEPLLTDDEKTQGVVGPQLADIYYSYSQLLKDLGKVEQTLENLEKAYRLRSQ